MEIEGSVALVTGANRALGRRFARGLLERRAEEVYGGARDPGTVKDEGATPVRLDVTWLADSAAAVKRGDDVNLVVNNAGIALRADVLGAGARSVDLAGAEELLAPAFVANPSPKATAS